MITIGIDPDTHYTSLVILDDCKVVWSYVIDVPKTLSGKASLYATLNGIPGMVTETPDVAVDRIAIEGMQVYKDAPEKANSLIPLAFIGGGIAYALQKRWPDAALVVPKPAEWKGQIPKKIHHKRILARLNAPLSSVVAKKHLSHVTDAAGLALWVQTPQALLMSDQRLGR